MRIFDLATLPAEPRLGLDKLPLMLPALIPAPHSEPVLNWWIRSVAPSLPRIDVDWDTGLYPSSARLLRRVYEGRGREGVVVVVRVVREGADLDQIAASPELVRFDRLVLAAPHRSRNVRLRALSGAATAVRMLLAKAWDTLADEYGLRSEPFAELDTSLSDILDPHEIVDAVNDLAEVELAGVRSAAQVPAVRRRLLRRLLGELEPDELVTLLGIVRGAEPSGGEQNALALEGLTERDLVLDGARLRWARWLSEPELVEGLFDLRVGLQRPEPALADWSQRVNAALVAMRDHDQKLRPDWASTELARLAELVRGGQLEEVRAALDAAAPELRLADTTENWRSDYNFVLGMLRRAEGDSVRAEQAFRIAIEHAHKAGNPRYEAVGHMELAEVYAASERWAEVEESLRQAWKLKESAGAGEAEIAQTIRRLGFWMATAGKPTEAESLLRRARDLLKVGGAEGRVLAVIAAELAQVLEGNGNWIEAEPLYREAITILRLLPTETRNLTAVLCNLALGLRSRGRWPDAEACFREALVAQRRESLPSLPYGITLAQFGQGLRDNDRWPEAEAMFRDALRNLEKASGGEHWFAVTLSALGIGLAIAEKWEEAEHLLREAWRLQRDSEESALRILTGQHFAVTLLRAGLWSEGETVLRETLTLQQAAAAPPEALALSYRMLVRCTVRQGKRGEAQSAFQAGRRLLAGTEARRAALREYDQDVAKLLRQSPG